MPTKSSLRRSRRFGPVEDPNRLLRSPRGTVVLSGACRRSGSLKCFKGCATGRTRRLTRIMPDDDASLEGPRFGWIDELTDSQCMEIFWLYVDHPEEFLARHPPPLLGRAMREALRQVASWTEGAH